MIECEECAKKYKVEEVTHHELLASDGSWSTYSINQDGQIELDFHGIKPDYNTRSKMKAVKIW